MKGSDAHEHKLLPWLRFFYSMVHFYWVFITKFLLGDHGTIKFARLNHILSFYVGEM